MAALDNTARTGVNQAPWGGTDYPFAAAAGLAGGVLDLYVAYADDGYVLPFSLVVTEPTPAAFAFAVTDAAATQVAAGAVADATTRAWGTRAVHEWTDEAAGWVLRAVVTPDLAAGEAVLDPRTCDRLPARVRSVRVGLVRMTGNVRFEAGFNMAMAGADAAAPADGGRYATTLTVDAVAGAGAGRVDGCEQLVPQLRKINQVGPDCGGNFTVEVDPCFRAGPPLLVVGDMDAPRTATHAAAGLTADEARHAVRLASDCHPCCECDYFARTYRGLKRQWERWRAAAADAEAVRDTYEDNRARWLASRDCRIENPARLVVSTDFNCKAFVGGSFCNFTSCCLTAVELRFTFRRYKGGVPVAWTSGSANEAYLSGSGTDGDERYAPARVGAGEVIRFFADFANPQATTVAKMKLCVNGCAADEAVEAALTVHAPDAAGNPLSGDPCEMAAATPPGWVTAAWAGLGVPATPTVRAAVTKTAALNPNPSRFVCGC